MKKFIFVVLLILLCELVFGNITKYTLVNSPGVRATGLGGAFSAVCNDYSAFFWNPAGLALLDKVEINGFYNYIFRGAQVNYGFNYTHPFLVNNMTLSATYLKTFFINSRFVKDLIYFSFGSFFDDSKKLSIGVNFKIMNFTVEGSEIYAKTTGIDFGVLCFPFDNRKLRFALFFQDINTSLKWNTNIKEDVPLLFKLGSSYFFTREFLIATDVDFVFKEDMIQKNFHFGGEKWFINPIVGDFALRIGFNFQESKEWIFNFTTGMSYKRENFLINYVYVPEFNDLGETHKISLSYIFELEKKIKKYIPKKEEKTEKLKIIKEKLKNLKFYADKKYISPNNDNINDKVKFIIEKPPLDIKDIYGVVEIIDINNNIIKKYEIKNIKNKIIWDGKDLKGKIVKDGDYYGIYMLFYKNAKVYEKKILVNVDNTKPEFSLNLNTDIFAPVINSSKKIVNVKIKTIYKDIKKWELLIKYKKNNVIRKISGEGLKPEFIWDGKDFKGKIVKDGDYIISVEVEDYAGNKFMNEKKVKVDTLISKVNITVENKIFKVSKEKVNFTINFKNANKIKKWDLEILDKNNNILRTFRNKTIAIKKLDWDGTDSKNVYVKEGRMYKYKLIVYQKNGIKIEKEGIIESDIPEFKQKGIELTLAAIDFKDKSFEISLEEYGYLNRAAETVKKYAQKYYLIIKGYATDYNLPYKNLDLSIKRVLAVVDYFITGQKIPEENIYYIGYGDGEYSDITIKDIAEKNGRRVEVILIAE